MLLMKRNRKIKQKCVEIFSLCGLYLFVLYSRYYLLISEVLVTFYKLRICYVYARKQIYAFYKLKILVAEAYSTLSHATILPIDRFDVTQK